MVGGGRPSCARCGADAHIALARTVVYNPKPRRVTQLVWVCVAPACVAAVGGYFEPPLEAVG